MPLGSDNTPRNKQDGARCTTIWSSEKSLGCGKQNQPFMAMNIWKYSCEYIFMYTYAYMYIYILYTYFYITKFMACNLYCPPSLLDRLARQDLLALLAPVLGWNSGYTCSILKSDSQGEHKHQDPLVVKHGLLENSPAIVRWFSHWFPSHLWLRKGKPTATGGRGWWTDSQ